MRKGRKRRKGIVYLRRVEHLLTIKKKKPTKKKLKKCYDYLISNNPNTRYTITELEQKFSVSLI